MVLGWQIFGQESCKVLATYVVLLTELLRQRGAHDVAADAGRGREVSLPRLAPGGGNA